MKTQSRIPGGVTICVTSCGRADLLERTLESFREFNTGGRFLLSEDADDPAVRAMLAARHPDIEIHAGGPRLGLMGSIDRVYSKVETDYIFHLEDDWEFSGPVAWNAAIAALEGRADVANVSIRYIDEIKPKYRAGSQFFEVGGEKFQLIRPDAHAEFFGWSSNPGLIKTELHRSYAPFARLMHDQMSGLIKKEGKRVAYLLPGVAGHIGQKRNITDPTMPARPKSRPAKWLRAIKKKLYYAGFRKEPF